MAAESPTECASAAVSKKHCFLKEKLWRIATKHGGKKAPALVAVAHTLLILIYETLGTGQRYQERNVPVMSEPQRRRLIRHHIRRLGKLGVATRSCRAAKRKPGRPAKYAQREAVSAHAGQPHLSSESNPACSKCHRSGIPCIHVRPRNPTQFIQQADPESTA